MSTGVETKLGNIVDVIRAQTAELRNDLEEMSISGNSGDTKMHTDCADLLRTGYTTSGEYRIRPENMWRPVLVFCDMETDGGGWTVMQRRVDGSENFQRQWLDYAVGFGNVSREFWLGNEFVHRITNGIPQELRFDLEDYDGERRYAVYGQFSLGPADDLYRLKAEYYSGDAGDSLAGHSNRQFSTTDKGPSANCAVSYKGGFWYNNCHAVNINGKYLKGNHTSYADGVNWYAFRGHNHSLKFTEMKFRPW